MVLMVLRVLVKTASCYNVGTIRKSIFGVPLPIGVILHIGVMFIETIPHEFQVQDYCNC